MARQPLKGGRRPSSSKRTGSPSSRNPRDSSRTRQRRYESKRESRNNPTLPLLIGGAGILVTGIVIFMFMQATSNVSDSQKGKIGQGVLGDIKETVVAHEIPAEAASPEEAEEDEKDADVLEVKKKKRVRLTPQELPHPESLSNNQKERLDALITSILDLNNPSSADESRRAVKTMGIEALPAMLTSWYKLDMTDQDQVIQANIMVATMLDIAGLQDRDYYRFPVQGMEPDDIEFRETVRSRWYRWWGENRDDLLPAPTED